MKRQALGIIETYGYIGAIEAADAATKAAMVSVLGIQKVTGGLVNITVTGEVAATKAAIDAARSAVEKLNIPITTHVIPRPDTETWKILPGKVEIDKKEKSVIKEEIKVEKEKEQTVDSVNENKKPQDENISIEELKKMRVVDLRALARKYDTSIERSMIKYANKKELLEVLEEYFKKEGDN